MFFTFNYKWRAVERVSSARVLGLFIQDNMNWNEHVVNIVKKAEKGLYVLSVLKRAGAVYTTTKKPVL